MHTPRILVASLALAASITFSGCELFEEGFEQPVTIYSFPTGADVTINGESYGKTPATVELGRLKAHQITLEKTGYKTMNESVMPTRNDAGESLVRFGVMEDTGLYYDLSPRPIKAQLVTEVLPNSRGPDAYSEMAAIITEVDARRESGQIGPVEHKYIVDQIVGFYAN
ncbi:PEGA domain-containing protein [Cerasicoccus arenae]|uniref:PEGA domain-containing protein n=1 Tax=Cerasicoccus arenae TaxID=424488 RepID=A0A8J3DIT3_9BACT|nr:PEGA domain-containing protein [Cerasicoccus arenae]MBK1858815.1 PEGA domain-containing protein [Cerasicoccus arenae]GHC04440.1 hypothetical protein GCM10007047_21480 [Cerasicoccus arenae]